MIKGYLKDRITTWYKNAKLDYNVNGHFVNAKVMGEVLTIDWVEENKPKSMEIAYYHDYTLEQLYNIWMEN